MRSSRPRAWALAVLVASAPLALEGAARGQASTAQGLETARSLFKQGKELREQGDLAGALEKLEAAHALGNTPVTGIELARTYVLAGKLVEAREVCLAVGRIPVASDESERSPHAREEAARLAAQLYPRIATLVVKIEGLPPGQLAHLVIDGVAVPDAAANEAQRLNPGAHELSARAGGAGAQEVQGSVHVEMKEGEKRDVDLPLTPAPTVTPEPSPPPVTFTPRPPSPLPQAPEPVEPPPPRARSRSALLPLGLVTLGAGAVVGTVAGLVAVVRKGELGTACNGLACSGQNGGADDLAAARSAANVSSVAFAVAAGGAVLALIGVVTSRSSSSSASPPASSSSAWRLELGLGMAGVHGQF